MLNPNLGRPNIPNPGGPLPPLPDPIPFPPSPDPLPVPQIPNVPIPDPRFPPFNFRSLRGGCYLLRYTPGTTLFSHYDGTMRVERAGFNTIASGDLYLHQTFPFRPIPPIFPPVRRVTEPNPSLGIPIFPRSRYRYYLRVTQILEFFTLANSFTLGFEMHRFDQSGSTWTNEGSFSAVMTWTTPPANFPSGADYLTGTVKNSSGADVGNLSMGWVSPHLRKGTLEIDRVSQSESPVNNGASVDWQSVFNAVGWDLNVIESDDDLTEPSGQSWSDAELHSAMLAQRDSANLDSEWRYHLLCVRRLDSTSRGIMYDAFGGDSNNIPREGAAISSHWVTPDTATWGTVRDTRFGLATAPYFRTAVHELGHALGLYHNTADTGFMNTTGTIAASATPGTFPANVQWSFAPADAKRLRHMPDPWVRPGMIPFGQPYGSAPISPDDEIADAEGLTLQVSPLLESVPIGAPVRVNLELSNDAEVTLPAPESLGFKGGHVKGKVIDPSGTVRTFWPLVRCIEEHGLHLLEPGGSIVHSLTLLRGAQGHLFPAPGMYQIIVNAVWDVGGAEVAVSGGTTVMVTNAVDAEHAKAALKIMSTPDALLTLALGGDHLSEGVAAIQAGLDNPVLCSHYEVIEAKRVGRRFGKRAADLEKAAELINDETVLSGSEVKRAAELLSGTKAATKKKKAVKDMVKTLKSKASQVITDDETEKLVKAL